MVREMNRIQQIFAVLGAVSLTGCIDSASNVAADGASNVKGGVRIDLTANSTMILVPTFAGDRLSRVSSVEGSATMVGGTIAVSTTPVEVGTVKISNTTYQINSDTPCTLNLQIGTPSCTGANQTAAPTNSNQAVQSAVSGPPEGISQVATPMSGMICAAHGSYPGKIWQKQFTVALTGSPAELDKITEAKYTVWSSYGQTYIGATRAKNFDAGESFLTPVTSWTIDPATAVTKSGNSITIAGATLSWSDSDPAKKAAKNCEPTAN